MLPKNEVDWVREMCQERDGVVAEGSDDGV